MTGGRRALRVLIGGAAIAVLAQLPVAAAEPLGGAAGTTLARERQQTPAELGKGRVDGLQYGDATEGLSLVDPPEASNDGGAHLSYPLTIPKGRGITPNLELAYDSAATNGWTGQGWDLSVGDISVDTRWGAPRFDPNKESETYAINGDMLVPNALGATWEDRVAGDRQDYTRQNETEYQQIIRHEAAPGGPANYFWEVHDKGGNVYWYGGQPDQGGPDGYNHLIDPDNTLTPTIDRSAIVTDEHGNGVRWLLSAQRDVGVNQIRYHYDTVRYTWTAFGWTESASCTSSGSTLCGKHTYLRSIDYTEAADVSPSPDGDAQYRVVFLRDSEVHPTNAVRTDPTVSAMGGYLDVTTDRLARVEVRYGEPEVTGNDPEGNETRAPRAYDQLAMRYDLAYQTGAFGKTLLKSVAQVGSDGTTESTHTFTYYDRVSKAGGGYDGLAASRDWGTGSDLPDRQLLDSQASIGALGSSESNSGEGHAYLGFNPALPLKVGSFGGSLQFGGGATESIAEWLDINGDGLPDKVYRDSDGNGGDLNDVNRNGPIRFRLNTSAPSSTDAPTFGAEKTVRGISKLSTEGNFGFEGAFQAFPGVTVALGVSAEVSWGDAYFSDANADGLPDYVSGGKVWFNHLDDDGVPTFVESDSSDTPVPVEDATASAEMPAEVQELQDELRAKNPLVDTVRRWTAPFKGTVSIDAPVALAPTTQPSTDGVRVAIEHDGSEVVAANLVDGSATFNAPITRNVDAGDDLYFRVGSVNDGSHDEVTWSPTISYTAIDGVANVGAVPLDVNGLSQTRYSAEDDFTLSGRPDTLVFMPYEGTVHFTATIDKEATTDDLSVRLLHNGTPVPVTVSGGSLAASATGQRTVSATFDVAAPVQPTDPDEPGTQDSVTLKLGTDSPIDLHAVDWSAKIAYTAAVDQDGQPRDLADHPLEFELTPEIEQYPQSSSTKVSVPRRFADNISRDASVSFSRGVQSPAGQAIVTVKTRNGVVARRAFTIPAAPLGGTFTTDVDLNASLLKDTDYWFDVNLRNPALSDKVALTGFKLTNGDAASEITVDAVERWTGRQGIFPLAYRGWAVAGYNADGDRATNPINEDDFNVEIDVDNLPQPPADPGFDDIGGSDPSSAKSFAYLPSVQQVTLPNPNVPAPIATPTWVGSRANLAASATIVRSSRLGSDSVTLGADPAGGSGRAVNRVSVTAPAGKLAFGIGPLSASFGASPSFGLVDYTDMNGDGFPDVVTPNSVTYTTQRGAYDAGSTDPGDLDVTNQDTTFALNVGFAAGLVDITANSKGKTNATQGGSANKGSDADDSGGGVGVGASLDVSWTSPNTSDGADPPAAGDASNPISTYEEQLSEMPAESYDTTAPLQLGLSDVNGDGLPDRVSATPQGVFANYNLGYRFADARVRLTTGGFESQESYAGGLSLGFSTPWADFSGGAALNWNIDLSRYAWTDVNGDGILDQIHKTDNSSPPKVRFGTGSGMLPEQTYGDMASSNIAGIDAGQQSSLDRTNGIGGQFDFTVAIGPLCLVACYVIVNPGASYQNSVSTTEVDLQDVNGDGYADSVQTLDDDKLMVRENKHADTNLLATVKNPIGGTTTITYERDGNTVDHPGSVWSMASVSVDDGRTGDGVDVRKTTYEYEGLKYDRLQRSSLGYHKVTENEIDTAVDPATAVRETVHTYRNDNVFEAGLETSTLVNDKATGDYLHGARQTWSLHDVRGTADMSDLDGVAALRYSIAPRLMKVVQEVGNGGTEVGQSTTTELTYNGLGDVVTQVDRGEDDDPDDDVVADISFSRCDISSTIGCAGDLPHDRPSPIWNSNLCPTWVSLPAVVTITNGKSGDDRKVYRHRDGRPALCDNASVTHLEEDLGDGEVAETDLTYDAWGSYDRIVYPVGENGRRYAVQYVWDLDGHSNVGDVTEYDLHPDAVESFLGDGLTGDGDGAGGTDVYTKGLRSTATFAPLANRVAERTDANGNVTSYTYDPLARIQSISSPVPTDPGPLVTYQYDLSSAANPTARVIARHFDVLHPDDTIDTASFVDGVGRVVQTQNDASLFRGAGLPAETGSIVSGTTIFDALGRPITQYYPTKNTKPFGVYEPDAPVDLVNDPHTDTVYDLWDLPNVITEPGDRKTTISYGYGQIEDTGPQLYETTKTAPNGRQTVTYTDMRDVVRAVDDVPVGAPSQLTRYDNDGMGQLLEVTDPSGNVTTHTYDIAGRRTSTDTPDGGLVEFGYDPDGQQTSKTTPKLRANGQAIEYGYDLHRLTSIDHPGSADDVSYTYGEMGAPHNGAGQVVRSEDGSQIERNQYDRAGNVVAQTSTMKLHAWTPTGDQSRFTWTTEWKYDGLGRLLTMQYPDSERLAYDYDAGGLVKAISGEEDGYETVVVGTDPDGNPITEQVPRTWEYRYLDDRQYDVFLHRRYDAYGNGASTEWTFDPNTQWLTNQRTVSANRDVKGNGAAYQEIQDLGYTYDQVGNPLTYRNDVPAPVPNLFSGPTSQTYTYDPYERIVGATGEFQLSTDKLQHYSQSLTFDASGNVTAKNQVDQIRNGKKELTQSKTTYSYSRTFTGSAPHQISKAGTDTYAYDADGNLLTIKDSKGKLVRGMTWDANDRMRNVNDASSSTDYTYDDSGQRTIERGPGGETATVNPWVTVRNTTDMYKYIWAGNDRVAIQRDQGDEQELKQYFLHKDLQGSTNIVTDVLGNTFQHQEYFPGGEVWIAENSTVFRTPFQYGGGYVDEVRDLVNFGARWYDPKREILYSPDPVLVDEPMAIVATPPLRAAYAYAGSNAIANIDPSGRHMSSTQWEKFVKNNYGDVRSTLAADPALRKVIAEGMRTSLPESFVRLGLDVESAALHQKHFKMIDDVTKPIVEINVSTGEVKLSPTLFKQFTVREGDKSASNAAVGKAAANSPATDATNSSGSPSASASTSNSAQQASLGPSRPASPAPGQDNSGARTSSKPLPPIPSSPKAVGGTPAKGSM